VTKEAGAARAASGDMLRASTNAVAIETRFVNANISSSIGSEAEIGPLRWYHH
jgi:hypothetical protein